MRRKTYQWEYNRESSLYKKSDYRSKFYNGKWEKEWLKEVASKAVKGGVNIYDVMWNSYNDKNEHMPTKLYKFFPFNQNSIKCIETNSVFLNVPRNFNDPFDCMLCANEDEYLKQRLIEYLIETSAVDREILTEQELIMLKDSRCEDTKYGNIYKTFRSVVFHLQYDSEKKQEKKGYFEICKIISQAEKEYNNALEKLRGEKVRITSFANISEFELTAYMELWAHYAQNHEGFCVEYDVTKPIADTNVNTMVRGGLLPCNYGAKQILLSKRKIYKYVKGIPFTPHEQIEFEKSILLSFLTKSSSWRYENEWRLILPLDICKIYGNMAPFFPIKAIYLGCRMPVDNREFMYRFARRQKIEIYDMCMHEYRFELEGDYFPVNVDEYFDKQRESYDKQLQQSKYNLWKNDRKNKYLKI